MRNLIGLLFFRGIFMPEVKPFKSIEEQIKILEERGLIIDDKNEAIKTLRHINYYRLSGYTLTLRNKDIFYKDITFSDMMQLYYFDVELRGLLLEMLDVVEVSFRTHIAYYHSAQYGALGYRHNKGFENLDYHKEFIQDLEKTIKSDKKTNEVFIKHYNEKYDGQFPIWVVVEMLTFGTISMLYSNSDYEIKKRIAKEIYVVPPEYIQNWLRGLVIIRNICAHRGRLYNRPIVIKPKLSNKDKQYGIRNDRVFSYIFVLKKLIVDSDRWDGYVSSLEQIIEKYPFVQLEALGFVLNWKEVLK